LTDGRVLWWREGTRVVARDTHRELNDLQEDGHE
jgi:hypothetical protein